MILTPKFIEIALRKPWAKQFKKLLRQYVKTGSGTYVIPHSVWESFLVDIGQKKSRGLGDTIAKVTKKLGMTPCGGCEKRRKYLNQKIQYDRTRNK